VTSRLRRLWTDYSADIVLIAATLLLLAVLYWLNALDNACGHVPGRDVVVKAKPKAA
jgi:hypothetical protein